MRRFSTICSWVTAGSATKIAIGTLLGVWPPIHRLRTIRHDLVQTVRRPIFRVWITGSQYRLFRIGFSSPDACAEHTRRAGPCRVARSGGHRP